jgi:hypothetical protein
MMTLGWTKEEVDTICKYYGMKANALTFRERALLVKRFEKEWDTKIEKAYEEIFVYPN